MVQLKKFSLRSVSEFLTEPEMKRVAGGYDGECGDGTDRGCWVISCGNGDTYYRACCSLVFCYGSGGCCSRC